MLHTDKQNKKIIYSYEERSDYRNTILNYIYIKNTNIAIKLNKLHLKKKKAKTKQHRKNYLKKKIQVTLLCTSRHDW